MSNMEIVSGPTEDSYTLSVPLKQDSISDNSKNGHIRKTKGNKGNRNKRKGTAFEYRIAAWYRGKGFIVLRARGSLGPADLIALKAGERDIFIQCKDYKSNYFDRNEMSNFVSFCSTYLKRCVWAYNYHSSTGKKRGRKKFLDLEKVQVSSITKELYSKGNTDC